MKKIFLSACITLTLTTAQSIIGPGNTKTDLFNFLINNYKTSSTLSYNSARDVTVSYTHLRAHETR